MFNIAIDGPAGAGKSSAAKLAAKELGFIYVDTGALYRTIGVSVLRKGLDTSVKENVLPRLKEIDVSLAFEDGEQHVYLNGEDVSKEIRFPEASMAASNVSAMQEVRDFLTELQRGLAAKNDCIMDGRDIGTVILPDAQLKIFLTASPEVRAMRRFLELEQKGTPVELEKLLDEIMLRDHQDSNREICPLKPAEDGVIIDASFMTLDEVVNEIVRLAMAAKDKEAAL